MPATLIAERAGNAGRDYRAGVRAMVPWMFGIGPYGLVIGISAAHAHIPTVAGWLTGPAIFSGSAQLATIQLLDAGAAPLIVIATVLAINARLVVYSGAMAAQWRGTPWWWRGLAAYLLVDPAFAVGMDRYERGGDRAAAHRHYLGGAVALWVMWLLAIAVGATVGARLPAGLHLEFVAPLFLLGEVIARLTTPAMRRAAFTGAAVAVAAYFAPFHLGPVAAVVAGLVAGLLTPEARS